MITGASRADAAVLVIAANEGVREQSRRHAYLLAYLVLNRSSWSLTSLTWWIFPRSDSKR
jgi:sulfate adenylyltransferase subunit 1 (EFTu-like GTPase family)